MRRDSYDLSGNPTSDGAGSFAYNEENQLVTNGVAGAWKSEFVYDRLGRRRLQRDYGWQGGGWVKTNETRLVYDGGLPVEERDGNNVVQVIYTRDLDLSGSLQGASVSRPRSDQVCAGRLGPDLAVASPRAVTAAGDNWKGSP